MRNRFLPLILIIFGLGIGLVIHHNFKDIAPTETVAVGESLALLDNVRGSVSVLPFGSTIPRMLTDKEFEVYHLDLLETQPGGQVTVKLPSGYELEVAPDSKLLFEAWGTEAKAPTYIHVIAGSYKMVRAGQRGQVFVQQNRKLIYPEGNVYSDSYHLTIKAPEFIPTKAGAEVESQEDENESPKAATPVPVANNGEANAELPQTLSNEEIDQVLANQRLHFERCQTNALRENLPSQGKILVGISILPSGKIQDVQAISSELNNPSFQTCVLSVFQRTQFRAFKGPTITRSYPLLFD